MVKYKFQCAELINGVWTPIATTTPTVEASTMNEAMNHLDILKWFESQSGLRIYRRVI